MSSTLFWLIFVVASMVALQWLIKIRLGFSLWHLINVPNILTSMGAKLACSARHISGFEKATINRDLKNYSPVFALLNIEYGDGSATARLGNILHATARYSPPLGCRLQFDASEEITSTSIPTFDRITGPWPAGEQTSDIEAELQTLTDCIVAEDNRVGLDTRALLVVQSGKLRAESYSPLASGDTRLLGWSMAKSLTAILIGRMEALGLANVDDSDLFPEWHRDNRRTITIRQLLQMCSGLQFSETYTPASDVTRMLFSSPSPSDFALRSKLQHTPGTHFSYSSGTTNLLARWMHNRLGGTQQYIDFLYDEFLKPMRMARTVLECDSRGVPIGSSYAFASARDWARLGQLLLDDGLAHGRPLLPRGWVQQATTPNSSENEPRYGYQLWLNGNEASTPRFPKLPANAVFMLGNREQKLMIAPSQCAIIVRIGWSKRDYPVERQFSRLLDQLNTNSPDPRLVSRSCQAFRT